VIAGERAPIGLMMMHRAVAADSCGCVIEVHSVSLEERGVMLPRLYKALAGCGCWTVSYKRCRGWAVEYSFEVELAATVELYCGLVQTGLEMTELSHRALTELCVLRTHEGALRGSRCLTPRVVSVRLRVSFIDLEEIAVAGVIAALA
jgi:hypothetical protein